MRLFLCLLLMLPGPAMAGQDTVPRPVTIRSITPLRVALPVMAPRSERRLPAGRAATTADPADMCEAAVMGAEVTGHLPPRLLHAISLVESGRADTKTGVVRAWPWTINAEGEGHFFDTLEQAIAAVEALQARGVQSIDVGCMQVNLMYHPHAFATLQDAFNPRSNAAYAAHFLNVLFAEAHDWPHAIAAYHSETPALGEAYRTLVMARWQDPDLRPVRQAQIAYGDFSRPEAAYGAFQPIGRVYGAFTAKP
jgi:transglycosylase-like protein with SLT domain